LCEDVDKQFFSIKKKWPELVKDSKVMWEMIDTILAEKYKVSKSVIDRRITDDKIKTK